MQFLLTFPPVLLALVAGLFTWFVTALGASLVFFFKDINIKVLNAMLGFAAGVMIAASFWSLLAPAIEMAEGGKMPAYVIVSLGFLGGGFFCGWWIRFYPMFIRAPIIGRVSKPPGNGVCCRFWQSPSIIFPKV